MRFLLGAPLLLSLAPARAEAAQAGANPIRKVVTMLQMMQQKVQAEGAREEELFNKFMCYCKNGKGDLATSIAAAEDKSPAVGSNIEASEGKLTQAKEDLKGMQDQRLSAEKDMTTTTALREKEAAAFAADKAESDSNIAALKKAIVALEKGMGAAFLQTAGARLLRRLAQDSHELEDSDRQDVLAFLDGSQGDSYAPQSGEIVGILKQMLESMEKDLAEAIDSEAKAVEAYKQLMAAKGREVEALTASAETRTTQIGELGVAIVEMKEDLSDTEASLLADKKFLDELESSCGTKQTEWDERSRTRAEEQVALADTIKVLNDDDALDLFKKTLPSGGASFVQLSVTAASVRRRALDVVRAAQQAARAPQGRVGLDLIMLALGHKSASQGQFDKVINMTDDMTDVLHKEQKDDDSKKSYCEKKFDESDDSKKSLERTVAEEDNNIATTKDGISTLVEEIESLEKGIQALDKAVAEATEQRKEENAVYKELMASNTAAKEVMGFAKNRLNKFYNKAEYKPPPKQEMSAEDRIYSNMGGEVTTPAPGGIAGTGVTALVQIRAHRQSGRAAGAPAPPPETWGAYAKKSEESTGVIAMIDLLIKDLDKEMTEAETQEKDSQADYEKTMSDSAEKRTTDSKALTGKGAAKADLEAELESHNGAKKSAAKELMATHEYIASLHSECDWLVKNHGVRKEARAGEVDSLKKAKAVLSGADYAFVQTNVRRNLRAR